MTEEESLEERWKPIVGYEGLYEISDFGRVKSLSRTVTTKKGWSRSHPERIRKNSYHAYGYPMVTLKRDGNPGDTRTIHSLIMEAFIGPCPSGMEVCHNDGVTAHSYLSNLRYGTRSDNMMDRAKHGTSNRGEQQWQARLTTEQVLEIRSLRGAPQRELAKRFGITPAYVSELQTGRKWGHLWQPYSAGC